MPKQPLRKILSIQNIALALFPFVLLSTLCIIWLFPQIRSDIRTRQDQLAATISSQVETHVETLMVTIDGIAAISKAGYLDLYNTPPILDAALESSTSLSSLYMVGESGLIDAVSIRMGKEHRKKDMMGLDLSRNALFKGVSVSQKPAWSDVFLSVVGGGLSVAYAAPAKKRMVVGEIDLSLLTLFLKEIATVPDQQIFILDQKGQVIADQDGRYTAQQLNLSHLDIVQRALASSGGQFSRFEFNGRNMIGSMANTSFLNWYALVVIPTHVAYRPMWTTLAIFASVFFATLFMGILVSVLSARRLANRFEDLAGHARKVASGMGDIQWPQSSISEFQELATDLQQMAVSIRDREAYNRLLFADSPIPLVVMDSVSLRYVDCNDAALRVNGIQNRNEIIGKKMSDFSTPVQYDGTPSDEAVKQHINACLENGFHTFEWRYVKGKDSVWHGEVNLSRFNHGEQTLLQFSVQDISKRKVAQQALRKSEANFRQVTETINEVFWLGDPDWKKVYYISPAYQEIWGRPCDQLYENPLSWLDAVVEEDREKITRSSHFRDKRNSEIRFSDYRIRRPDGTIRWISVRAYPIFNKKGDIDRVAGIAEDISARKFAEEERNALELQLRQSHKMEAIGTLAGGIAHDFNNILSPVMGYTEMMMEDIPKNSPFQSQLEGIYKASLRARDLVKQILTFSRQAEKAIKPLKIQLIIKEVLRLARSSLPSTIKIESDIHNDCGMVMADPTQIHQIAMNLVTNAFHAMEKKRGILKVGLEDVSIDPGRSPDPKLAPGSYVRMTVADTGIGIDASTLDRIFDPYFTTKDKDKGTGLGLSVVHGIVTGYKGAVLVKSKPGKGTVFMIYIPRIQSDVEVAPEAAHSKTRTGREQILIVDDEEPILHMIKVMLERLGYRVTARNSSVDALEAFRALPYKFDLVITDMTMPHITGDELTTELKKINPDIPVIVCTGFSEMIKDKDTKAMGIDKVLMKPIARDELAAAVRNLMDG